MNDALYGEETAKALANFPISGQPMPLAVVHELARIKGAAARVNAELGLLEVPLAETIEAAAQHISVGRHDEQFPIDVFQTGSGTSTNMNVNEVISALCGGTAHPNDHVNMGQSSNDTVPSAVHLAALAGLWRLHGALGVLQDSLESKSIEFHDVVKAGRTHLMDAVPVTLGQEFRGYCAQVRMGREALVAVAPRVGQLPLGGTAVGNGLNTPPDFAERVRAILIDETGFEDIAGPADPFEAQSNRDGLVALSGVLKGIAVSLTKIAQDIALMGSGPRAGLAELVLPSLQKGSSIMPGKVNPVIPEVVLQVAAQVIGNDTAITIGGMQGQFELNVRVPLIAKNLLESLTLLTNASMVFAERCIDGLIANLYGTDRSAEATLAVATALNAHIGYDRATAVVTAAADSGRPLRDVAIDHGVDPELYDRVINLREIAEGNGTAN